VRLERGLTCNLEVGKLITTLEDCKSPGVDWSSAVAPAGCRGLQPW